MGSEEHIGLNSYVPWWLLLPPYTFFSFQT